MRASRGRKTAAARRSKRSRVSARRRSHPPRRRPTIRRKTKKKPARRSPVRARRKAPPRVARKPRRARAKTARVLKNPRRAARFRSRPRPRVRARKAPRGTSARLLKGHVDLVGLGHLLQLLSLIKSEGVLTVARKSEKQSIHLGHEGIRILSSTVPRVKRLSKLARQLSNPRVIAPFRLKSLLKKEKLLGWTLGHAVFAEEQVSVEKIQEALRHQVEEEILDLFIWDNSTFIFTEGPARESQLATPLAHLTIRADVTALLLEATRRADELLQIRQTLPDDSMKVHKIPRDIYADELGEDVIRVDAILPLINGHRSLGAILQASIYPKFATLKAVQKLLHLGYAKARDREGQTLILSAAPATQ